MSFKTGNHYSSFEMTQVHFPIEITVTRKWGFGLKSLKLQRVNNSLCSDSLQLCLWWRHCNLKSVVVLFRCPAGNPKSIPCFANRSTIKICCCFSMSRVYPCSSRIRRKTLIDFRIIFPQVACEEAYSDSRVVCSPSNFPRPVLPPKSNPNT